jgi:hypothetical protein
MKRSATLGVAALVSLASCMPPEPGPTTRATSQPPPEQNADWSDALPTLLPAIRACLERGGPPAAAVTKAWPIAEQLAGVRLLASSGERLDCVAERDGSAVLLTERVWTVSQLPGERSPMFTPLSEPRPVATACLAVTVARDFRGAVAGWLSTDVCRGAEATGPAADATPLRGPRRDAGNS